MFPAEDTKPGIERRKMSNSNQIIVFCDPPSPHFTSIAVQSLLAIGIKWRTLCVEFYGHMWSVGFHYKRHDFRKILLNIEIMFDYFTTFVCNISHSKDN